MANATRRFQIGPFVIKVADDFCAILIPPIFIISKSQYSIFSTGGNKKIIQYCYKINFIFILFSNNISNIIHLTNKLVISNQGYFIPKSIENVLKDGFSSPYYRNPFLATAMVNLNMIDTVGSGIRRVFNNQKVDFSQCQIMI